ncbi:MAG: efflux RND transporter periplasmic adaptor subunit [Bacteroidetes bacterium]|nr:MAG: efflux RND transporter periplasmic adaptor subunit [Bacteroidota bacterium]
MKVKTVAIRQHISTEIMQKITLFFVMLTLIFAASSCQEEEKSDTGLIREKISGYNEQIVELNQKISDLERELEALGETTQNRVRTPVTLTTLGYEPFDHYFRINAKAEAIREAMISPETNGQITSIEVEKGQEVRRGQVLARLNVSVIENNIAEAKTSLQLSQTVYNRQKNLWEQEIGSEMQYLEARNNYESLQSRLKSLESQLEMAVMRAPFDGIVDEIFAKEGELAMPGSRVMQVINLDQLYINADVSETFLPVVGRGDKVILRFDAFPGYEEWVPIHRLGNVINPENRTFRLQVRINNPNKQFKPNMMASMGIRSFSTDQALVVPSILIKQDVQGHFLFVARENEEGILEASKIYIERGRSGEGKTMIESGIEPGDRIINQGHNRVSDGTLIKISEDRNLARNE